MQWLGGEEESGSFFEKKEPKKLLLFRRVRVAQAGAQPVSQVKKFFCFFLFTKRRLFLRLASLP
jgi:hypothetical protein